LNMVAAAVGVDDSVNSSPRRKRLADKVEDAAGLIVRDLGYRDFPSVNDQSSGIVHLTAAGWIKSSTVENDRMPAFKFEGVGNAPIELVEKGIVVIEAFSHHQYCRHSHPGDETPDSAAAGHSHRIRCLPQRLKPFPFARFTAGLKACATLSRSAAFCASI